MCASYSAFKICDVILSQVRSSNLNFVIQETPFSMLLTIRKSFNKDSRNLPTTAPRRRVPQHFDAFSVDPNLEKEALIKELEAKVNSLEETKDALARKYEEEVNNAELLVAQLKEESDKLNNLQANFEQIELNLRNVKSANKKLNKIQ